MTVIFSCLSTHFNFVWTKILRCLLRFQLMCGVFLCKFFHHFDVRFFIFFKSIYKKYTVGVLVGGGGGGWVYFTFVVRAA